MSDSSSRARILMAARQNLPAAVPLPPPIVGIEYADSIAQFTAMVEAIGGRAVTVASHDEANGALAEHAPARDAKTRLSRVPGIGTTTFVESTISTRQTFTALDLAILPGHLGVAENGAIWITETADLAVAAYFACEHLVLVVLASTIVHNMHQAYAQIAARALYPASGFGTFIAGPSKTADIEQSLVIGAQGPRSLLVLVMS